MHNNRKQCNLENKVKSYFIGYSICAHNGRFWPGIAQNSPKTCFFLIFLGLIHRSFLIFCLMIENHEIFKMLLNFFQRIFNLGTFPFYAFRHFLNIEPLKSFHFCMMLKNIKSLVWPFFSPIWPKSIQPELFGKNCLHKYKMDLMEIGAHRYFQKIMNLWLLGKFTLWDFIVISKSVQPGLFVKNCFNKYQIT